jgi:hypothetical protein
MSLPCARWSERAVHAGYTQQQQVAECNGHERSRRVTGNCRSSHRPRYSQAGLHEVGQSSSLPPPPTGLLLAAVREDGRLADPSDLLDGAAHGVLLDDDGAPDPEKVKAAISELLARRPHYAKRIGGDVGQGARPGPADPNEELWGDHPVQDALDTVPLVPPDHCEGDDQVVGSRCPF